MKHRFLSVVLVLFLSLTQSVSAQDTKPKILALGDSLLAWHKLTGRSIIQRAGRHLDVKINDRSRSGARIIYKLPISGTFGFSIPRQYMSGDWDWVIINGGGNDLWLGCGCSRCNRKLNKMISQDARTGAIPKLIAKARRQNAKVLYIGYLRTPGKGSPIEHCKDEGDILENRIAALAAQDDGVHFLSLKELVPDGDLSYHAADRIHPSVKASKAIGKMVADIIGQ